MANALQTLFTEIADSIRGGLPNEGKMSPNDFPEKIDEIVANGGTGGGGGGGDSGDGDIEMGVTVYATMSGQPSSLSASASTKKGSFYIDFVPEYAELEWLSYSARVYLVNTSTGEETTLENVNLAWPVEYTETEVGTTYPGYNRLTFREYSYTKPKNEWLSTAPNKNVALFRLPNIYVKDKILYAAPNCKGLLMGNFENNPSDIEGINLRGSQVKTLPPYFGNYRKNLKKIWLSEVYTFQYDNPIEDIFSQLEEIHFTATTPPTLYSYRNFDSLPTTCKIYVPAGYLDAYTSAQYYPDPTKYTYIEE